MFFHMVYADKGRKEGKLKEGQGYRHTQIVRLLEYYNRDFYKQDMYGKLSRSLAALFQYQMAAENEWKCFTRFHHKTTPI